MQKGGYEPGLVDRKQEKAFFGRGGGDPDGDFPLSGDGKLGELSGMIGKTFFVFRVKKYKFKCF